MPQSPLWNHVGAEIPQKLMKRESTWINCVPPIFFLYKKNHPFVQETLVLPISFPWCGPDARIAAPQPGRPYEGSGRSRPTQRTTPAAWLRGVAGFGSWLYSSRCEGSCQFGHGVTGSKLASRTSPNLAEGQLKCNTVLNLFQRMENLGNQWRIHTINILKFSTPFGCWNHAVSPVDGC